MILKHHAAIKRNEGVGVRKPEKVPRNILSKNLTPKELRDINSKIRFLNFLKKFYSLFIEKSQLVEGKTTFIQAGYYQFHFDNMCFNDINNKLEETLQENIDSLLNLIQNIDGRIMKKGSESAIKEWTSGTFLIQSLEIAFKTLYPSTPSKEKSFQNIYKKFTYELQRRCIILGIQEKTKELVDNLINYYFGD